MHTIIRQHTFIDRNKFAKIFIFVLVLTTRNYIASLIVLDLDEQSN